MASDPKPLPIGSNLADRFVILEMLGRGGFGIAYRATDLLRGDEVVIKELAPDGVIRSADLVIKLQESTGPRLRERFLEEAAVLSHLEIEGVPKIRNTFRENGTAYYAMEFVRDATTLEEFVRRRGPLPISDALAIFEQILEILDQLHAKNVLHRDLKPTNILLDKDGLVHVIDFGSAREWHADALTNHTIFYTPGFAPPEQTAERAKRGPATDIYAVCATMYVLLTGTTPPSAADRAAGVALLSLSVVRPEIDPLLALAIERGMNLSFVERPQNVEALKELMVRPELDPPEATLQILDETLQKLKNFRFDKRACPACGDLLVDPKPIKKGICPVCQSGLIRKREISERLCPCCHAGVLTHLNNRAPLAICPKCSRGQLSYVKRGFLSGESIATCRRCEARFEVKSGQMTDMVDPHLGPRSFEYWRNVSKRSTDCWICSDCQSQFDILADGRWHATYSSTQIRFKHLYPDEWARVAIGLEPGAGNASCESCGADYYWEKDELTLLDCKEDPYRFAEVYIGRLLQVDEVRWFAVGKTSPRPGLLCQTCHCEFDREREYLRLVLSTNKRLATHLDKPKTLLDWHRIAQGLPTIDQESEFEITKDKVLREAYRMGEFSLDDAGELLWKGSCIPEAESNTTNLTITNAEVAYGGLLRKRRKPTDAIVDAWADDRSLHLRFSGNREHIGFEIEPISITIHLSSGTQTIELNAKDLAGRLHFELAL